MTSFDMIGAIELTLSASILVAVVALELARSPRSRSWLAAALGGWFLIVVTLAATGALHDTRGIAAAGLGLSVMIPIGVFCAVLFGVPEIRNRLAYVPLAPLIAVHAVRVLGITFLILQAGGRLPTPFAPSAGWGDIAVGLLAMPIAWLVVRERPGWRAATLVWNLLGLADLATAVTLGVLSSPGPLRRIFAEPGTGIMSTLPWMLIPGFIVPLLATTHLVIFYRLKATVSAIADSRRPLAA